MRLLFVIPHYCATSETTRKHGSQTGNRVERGLALRRCILSLHQTLGTLQAIILVGLRKTVPANQPFKHQVHVCVVTNEVDHALAESDLPSDSFEQIVVSDPPISLGFACHRLMKERAGEFDYFGYLEDDLILHDSWFLEKLVWFNGHLGDGKLLLPNRYEVSANLAYQKCYLDGDLKPHVSQPFQDIHQVPKLSSKFLGRSIEFERPLNPHSGCFFLNHQQMQSWSSQEDFGIAKDDFIGPLESAASLSVMKTFHVYKPVAENASFLEIEHHGDQFVRKIRKP